MSKFTKGTWKACIDGSVDIEDDRGHLIGTICDIVRLYEDEAEAMANARLIASAPKMYWLLNEMLKIEALKAQAKTDDNSPLFMKALVAQDGADNIARKLIAYIDGEEEQS